MTEEIQQHLDALIERNLVRGLSASEARNTALRQFGGVEQIKEIAREQRVWIWADEFLQDLRFGCRLLRKSPAFAFVAILTLAVGIGSNSALFTVVSAVLLKPLPYPRADRLVVLRERIHREGYERDQETVTPGDFTDCNKHKASFSDVAAVATRSFDLTGTGKPVQIEGEAVSANLFSLLQVAPVVGRGFRPEEDQNGAGKVAVLGYGLWVSRFAADPRVVGRSILLDGTSYVVAGVMPKGFSFPDADDQLWVPLALSPEAAESRVIPSLRVVARLRDGITMAQAQAQMAALSRKLAHDYSDTNSGLSISLVSLREQTVGNVRPALLVLWLCTSLVLVIVCVNLANLLLARASVRRREFAIRLALGAARSRIVRQLITESLLLSLLGGGAGFLFTVWSMHALRGLSPPSSFPYIPRIEEVGINGTPLVFALALSFITGIMSSLIPALRTGSVGIQTTLKEEDARGNSRGSRRWLRSALVIMQTALSVVVMSGAGLLLRSFVRLANVPLGFQPENVLTMRVLPRGVRYTDFRERLNFYQQALDKIQNIPGVQSVGAVSFLPLTRTRQFNAFSIEGGALADMSWSPSADVRAVTPEYLEAMKVTLVGGRRFSWEDTPESGPVVIVSTKLVQEFFPKGGAIGSHIRIGNPHSSNSWRTVIGVVGDVPYFDMISPAQPTIYVPYAQTADLPMDLHDLAVRTKESPTSLAAAVRSAIWSVDSNLAVSRVRTMEDVYSISVTPQRFNLLLLALMAGLVLLLALVGLYGVTSCSVAQRTGEIAVRLALGAVPVQMLRLILLQSGVLVFYGVAVGLALSFSLTSLMENLLFNVGALDLITYGLVAALLSVVGLAACFGPARAAMRIDPMTVLRCE
jgi:putative ABC transport system permease protein